MPCATKKTIPRPFSAHCSNALDGLYPLLSPQLTINLTRTCNGGSMFYLLLHTDTKILFISSKDLWTMVRVINTLEAHATFVWKIVFSYSNFCIKYSIYSLLISLWYYLPPAFLVNGYAILFCGFFCVFGIVTLFGCPKSIVIISVRKTSSKLCKPSKNSCFYVDSLQKFSSLDEIIEK